MLEVEVKIALSHAARAELEGRLAELGATLEGERHQSDTYFAHPTRDYAATDEALRVRRDDDVVRLTYKGPKLDPPRKTREEIEFPVATDLDTARTFLTRLGFTAVATVAKKRRVYAMPGTEVCLDDVEGLGPYCEVEVAADSVEAGRDVLEKRLSELGLAGYAPEPRSYLELLRLG